MDLLDCIGQYCAETVFCTRTRVNQMKLGDSIEILADDPETEEELRRFCKSTGQMFVKAEKIDDGFRFVIKKIN